MRTVRLTLVTLAVAVLAGGAPLRAQRRGNVLSTEEIERAKSNVGTAYDLVQTLRPRWLQVHELTRLPGRADEPVRTNAERTQMRGKLIGPSVQLRVAQRLSVEDQGRGMGSSADLFFKEVMNADLTPIRLGRRIPGVKQCRTHVERKQRESANRVTRIGSNALQ